MLVICSCRQKLYIYSNHLSLILFKKQVIRMTERRDERGDGRFARNLLLIVAVVAVVGLLNSGGLSTDTDNRLTGMPVAGQQANPPAGGAGATPTIVRPADIRTRIDQSGQVPVTWPTQQGSNPNSELALPFFPRFGAAVGNAAVYCNSRFRLSPKNIDFCQFNQTGNRGTKTVGRFAVMGMPNAWQSATSGVRSIAVDVSKIANSGAGDVGFHVFYTPFPSPGDWEWAQYCVLPANQASMTCTKNFATPVNVGKVMVSRANFGADRPTPYVTDVRLTT